MKNSIIKSYSDWLTESLGLHEAEGSDSTSMYQAGDRKGLVALAQTADSAQIKAHPAYAAVMEWWKNGSGNLGLIRSILKQGSARKTDTTRSLKSIYYWSGTGSSGQATANLTDFYKVSDSIVRNGQRLGLDQTKLTGLATAVRKLKELQPKGFVPKTVQVLGALIPGALVDNKFDTLKISDIAADLDKPKPNDQLVRVLKAWRVAYYSTSELGKDPKSSIDWLEQMRTNPDQVNNYWAASTQINDENKKALLDLFQQKAEAYVARKQKAGVQLDMPKAIMAATDLYIAPQNEKITVKVDTTVPQAAPPPLVFSYPEDPKGDETSPNFKKGLSMFPDNGVAVKPEAIAEINAAVEQAVDAVKSAGGTITAISTWGYSSTSRVPSKYRSANGKTGNAGLAQDRLASINKALADAIAASGITVVPTVNTAKNREDPERGPVWTAKEMADPKFGKPGARTPEYEAIYSPWRYSMCFLSFTYEVPQKPETEVLATATPSGEWKGHISWADESISIKIPRIRFSLPSMPTMPAPGGPLKCPKF
jgi:hypothetical protein